MDDEKRGKNRKILKIVLLIIAGLSILFGLMGGALELSAENPSAVGLILAALFIAAGGVLIFFALRKGNNTNDTIPVTNTLSDDFSVQAAEDYDSVIDDNRVDAEREKAERLPYQRTFLIVTAYIEIVFGLLVSVVALFFGYGAVKAGEMGAIIGVMMFMALLMIAAYFSIRIVALRGILKNKRWGILLNLGLTAAATVILLIALNPLALYTAYAAWCSYVLSRNPLFT